MKPDPREFALLTLLGVSASYILDPARAKLRFVAPYIVRYAHGQPSSLWLPDLDEFYGRFVNDGDGDPSRNRALWEKYNASGRPRSTDVEIWKYITNHLESRPRSGNAIEVEVQTIQLSNPSEFIVSNNRNAELSIMVATAYQACGTLIAVISFAAKEGTVFSEDDCIRLKSYLESVREGRYFRFLTDLHIPTIGVDLWRAMRLTEGANHWGDNPNKYSEFWTSTARWVVELKRDFDGDYMSSATPGQLGRPTIKEVLTVDEGEIDLKAVMERRVTALLGASDGRTDFEIHIDPQRADEVTGWRYMWFNAIAISDSIAAAIRSYRAIRGSSDTNRLSVDDLVSSLGKLICTLVANQNRETIQICVRVYEPGLIGEWKQEREGGGTAFNNIYAPAVVAGASSVKVTYFTREQRIKTIKVNKAVDGRWVVVDDVCGNCKVSPLFTGICYKLEGEWNANRDAWVVRGHVE